MTIRESVIKRLGECGLVSYSVSRVEIPKNLMTQVAQSVYRDVLNSSEKTGKELMQEIDIEIEGHGYTIPGEKQDTPLLEHNAFEWVKPPIIEHTIKPIEEDSVNKLLDGIDIDMEAIKNSEASLRFQVGKLRGVLGK